MTESPVSAASVDLADWPALASAFRHPGRLFTFHSARSLPSRLKDAEVRALVEHLASRDAADFVARLVVASWVRGAAGVREAIALLRRLAQYTSIPGVLGGIHKVEVGDELARDVARAIGDPAVERAHRALEERPLSFPRLELWAFAAIADRVEPGVVEGLVAALDDLYDPGYVQRALVRIRAATEKRRAVAAGAGAADEGALGAGASGAGASGAPIAPPAKASEVRAWLKATGGGDVAVLAPVKGQRAAARIAAVRALAAIGDDSAFEVLRGYAEASPSDAMLAELMAAWPAFDRHAFAETMLVPARGRLALMPKSASASLEGLDAVPGLTSLTVIGPAGVDLTPVWSCGSLEGLLLRLWGAPRPGLLVGIGALSALRTLVIEAPASDDDLAELASTGVSRLRVNLASAAGGALRDMRDLDRALVVTRDDEEDAAPGLRPELAELALDLIERGVAVSGYAHEKEWAGGLRELAQAIDGAELVERSGFVGVVRPGVRPGAGDADALGRSMSLGAPVAV